MEREAGMQVVRRAVSVGVNEWPEMADRYMEVPLEYFTEMMYVAFGVTGLMTTLIESPVG